MTAPATVALQALKAHLETVTVANGYQINIAAVAIGRAALAVGSKAALPVITLTTVRDDPPEGSGYIEAGSLHQSWTRLVQMEALIDGSDAWEADLDAALHDLRKALTRYKRPLLIGPPEFTPPALDAAGSGGTAALLMPLKIPYELSFFDSL